MIICNNALLRRGGDYLNLTKQGRLPIEPRMTDDFRMIHPVIMPNHFKFKMTRVRVFLNKKLCLSSWSSSYKSSRCHPGLRPCGYIW